MSRKEDHVGEKNEMPGLFTLTSSVGALATNVRVMIHNRPQPLSQIVLVIGDAGSKKSTMDEVYNEWAFELIEEKWKNVRIISRLSSSDLCAGHPARGPTSGSEAYLKSASASDSCQWRSKILSVSIRLYQCFAFYLLCALTPASR